MKSSIKHNILTIFVNMSDRCLRNMKDGSGSRFPSSFYKRRYLSFDDFFHNLFEFEFELKFSHFIDKLRIYCLFAILREIPTNDQPGSFSNVCTFI